MYKILAKTPTLIR